jgi:PAS domain S-box-containing protein
MHSKIKNWQRAAKMQPRKGGHYVGEDWHATCTWLGRSVGNFFPSPLGSSRMQQVAQSSNLLETLQHYSDLFTFAPAAYVVLRHDARVEDVNRAAGAILGWPRTWIVGQPFTRWLIKKDAARFGEYLDEVCSSTETVTADFRIKDRKGRYRDLRLDGVGMMPRGGTEPLCQVSIEDVTRERSTEREARQLQDELAHAARLNSSGEMVAALAHELNQPLGAISLYCSAGLENLRSEHPNPAQLQGAFEKIAAAANHAAGTIRSLRSFLGKAAPVLEDVDLDAVLHEAVRMAGAYAKDRGGRIELRPAGNLPKWRGNRVHLQQVLLNLLQNSLDAMQSAACDEARVVVSSATAGADALSVRVEDTGPGMTPLQRRRAFEPFFTTKKNGMGVGLPISRSIIESYGGHLTVESPETGGTIVSFTLPIN